jgi:hypothetical protein
VKRTFTFELSNMLGTQSKRRQECRRGTQECARHNDFKGLRFFAENYLESYAK